MLKAALLKESAEKARITATPNASELRHLEVNPANFLLRSFNALALDLRSVACKLQAVIITAAAVVLHPRQFRDCQPLVAEAVCR